MAKLARLSLAFLSVPIVCALLWASPAAAANSTMKFTYQGNLRQAGFLVNGGRSMVFNIYTSSHSLTPIWTSPQYNVTVSTGVFRVTLEPDLSIWHDNNSLWLELEVEGTKMSPMEEITASPYAVNAMLVGGKQYTNSVSMPVSPGEGDLWYDIGLKMLKYWDGTQWTSGSGAGLPGIHAPTHAGTGTDPITSLGAHAVTGPINLSAGANIIGSGPSGVTVASNLSVMGVLNQYANLTMGGPGYSVSVSSSLDVLGNGIFLSTVTMVEGNLKYGTAPVGKVLKSLGDGYVYWGNDNSTPVNGDPYRLQMINAAGNELANSLFLQNPAETSITLIQGSSLTVSGAFEADGAAYFADNIEIAGMITADGGLLVAGSDATISNNLYVEGNTQLGDQTTDLTSINRINEPGVALSVDSSGASGSYAAKFYSGGTLAAWIKKK